MWSVGPFDPTSVVLHWWGRSSHGVQRDTLCMGSFNTAGGEQSSLPEIHGRRRVLRIICCVLAQLGAAATNVFQNIWKLAGGPSDPLCSILFPTSRLVRRPLLASLWSPDEGRAQWQVCFPPYHWGSWSSEKAGLEIQEIQAHRQNRRY